ncbi:MAG: flagellar motor switch protein FliN [Pseudomonadota bacterium]|jgi:flagellar motor switch protein FliN/FliY
MAENETPGGEAGATEAGTQEVVEGLEKVADAASEVIDATRQTPAGAPTLDLIMDVTLQVAVEVGRARMSIQDLLQLGAGSVVELQKLAGEPLDIYINGKAVAHGEAVIVNEKFGVRLTDIISQVERVEGLK